MAHAQFDIVFDGTQFGFVDSSRLDMAVIALYYSRALQLSIQILNRALGTLPATGIQLWNLLLSYNFAGDSTVSQ